MKKVFFAILYFISITLQAQEFKFAFVTDTHIGSPNGVAEEDLQRTVNDINALEDLDFVLLTGDITEMGTDEEIELAKQIIDQLDIPWYILPGNHDTGWSESGGVSFIREFGYDKFAFEHEGYKFIGCASGPYVRMSDGHIPRDAIVWLDEVLAATPKEQPIIFVNHYPLDNSLDNWYEATERLKNYNTQFAICGHGHRNKAMDFEGIPGSMGRSNLRAGDSVGGYNIVEITPENAIFRERTPGGETAEAWRKITLGKRNFENDSIYERPSYAVNDSFSQVEKKWEYHSNANVISTPAYVDELIIFGNSTGLVEALSSESGEVVWTYETQGGIFSSPATFKNSVILGSGDGNIYSFDAATGKLNWKTETEHSVLGSPVVQDSIVYIGGSDGKFRALDAETGSEKWTFKGLEGPVVSTPLLYEDQVIFGAWDRHLYALDKETGSLKWKWNNESPNRMFSPAMVIPVANEDVVYIVAPDRYLSAIDAKTGESLWRTNEATVRESLGISEDGNRLFGKTMNDEVVIFETNKKEPKILKRINSNFGYDHVPSMLYEQDGQVLFGTRNGVIYSIDPATEKINWKFKIDHSMVNTIRIIDSNSLVASTMDGKVILLTWK
ncbi:PQQ-binding-like beta-propeller repeat protein [Salinimicrobium terrae]|uniref:outer membrane protein assembly factor BamB family protein n=1 Tax=Salinimicrobium terrae TaxID=470866 RepID=UPI00041587DB|nr:PQQ-binding-like beta-propeller repeat protein [Salinimicrobium terrae]